MKDKRKRGLYAVVAVKVKEIIRWAEENAIEFEYYGDAEVEITGFSSLTNYKDGCITWINLKNSVDENVLPRIQCAIIQKGVKTHPKNYFVTEESKKVFFAVLRHFFSGNRNEIAERKNTYIGENVVLGKNVMIGCNCVLDGEIHIGDNTLIEHNVTILNRVVIGSGCIIHAGTVIGKDGFGYSFDKSGAPQKIPHFGGVKIGDRVEIGGNCAIDRGTIDDTTIGSDVKIDSLVLVAHNVMIGKDTMVVGEASIGGSCVIGQKSYIAPHAFIKNKTSIGDNCFIGVGTIVTNSINDNISIARSNDKPKKNRDYRRFL